MSTTASLITYLRPAFGCLKSQKSLFAQVSFYRLASTSTKTRDKTEATNPVSPTPAKAVEPLQFNPGKANEDYVLKTLDRPLGLTHPPQPGDNSGIDLRSWTQRRDDFLDYDKHLERRKELYVIN
jgi:mitochondrial ATPase complex subunit ATP10